MKKRNAKIGLTPEQVFIGGMITIAAIGFHTVRMANKSPEEKAKARSKREERRGVDAIFKPLVETAKALDQSRWREFMNDEHAQRAFYSERCVTIRAKALPAEVKYEYGAPFGHMWERVTARANEGTLSIFHEHDGGGHRMELTSPSGNYEFVIGGQYGFMVIGDSNGPPTQLQRLAANLLAALQLEGYYQGIICLQRSDDSGALLEQHYAAYARRRGWPAKRGAETKSANAEYKKARASL